MTSEAPPSTRGRFPPYTWLGLAVLVSAEIGLYLGVSPVATWFTPIQWSGYFLLVDGILQRLRGRSWLSTGRREFPLLLLLSVLVWLLFEAYNFHLKNWFYEGLPSSAWLRDLGYFWSFATIMPGVFVTADLVSILLQKWTTSKSSDPKPRALGPKWAWFLAGLALVTIPLAVSQEIARYLFAAVWLGFIFLLDPLNQATGGPSLRHELEAGNLHPLGSYLLAGLLCGFLWEIWNYQAYLQGGAYWIYAVPNALRLTGLHFGQMPVEGLLGFPPFALELRAFYLFLRAKLGGTRVFGPPTLNP